MLPLKIFFQSTIGRKQIVGITGLGLALFVLSHALGNILIFVGDEAYNMYSHNLVSNPAIYLAEAGLVGLFFAHLGLALRLALLNKKARGSNYASSASGEKATSFASKTMWHQGIIILVFVVLHLITFKYGPYYEVEYGGQTVRDLFTLMVEIFQSPIYVGGYVFSVLVLGVHLSHGVSSAIRTLGFNHPSYDPKVRALGFCYGWFVALTFMSQPLYVFFFH